MKQYFYALQLIYLIIFFTNQLQAQCPNDNTQYGTSNAPTSLGTPVTLSPCMYGGEYRLVNNLVAGNQYSFETCGDTDFDTQISLYDNTTGINVGYNDDFCGAQSKVTFTSNGNSVRVLIDKYNCSNQSSCMTLVTTLESSGTPVIDPCNTISPITCSSNTSFSLAGSPGVWSNGPWGTPGTEKVYEFTPSISGNHSVVITNNDYYVDLFYKNGSCSGTGWTFVDDIYTSATNVINLTAGTSYLILLDDENTTASSGTITINCPQPCSSPTNISAIPNSTTTATLNWTAASSALSYDIEYGITGFAQGSGTTINGISSPYSLTGLTASTSYDFYIRSNCGSLTSTWEGPISFNTLCLTITAPYTQDFESLALTSPYTDLPICWAAQTGPDFWDVTNDVVNTGHTYLPNIGDHTSGTGNYMWIDASSNITGNAMISPTIDVSGLTVPYVGFWFASNNSNNAINHTISLDAWDGSAWVNLTSISGNFPGWVQVASVVPGSIPSQTQFRIQAIANASSTPSDNYFNDLGVDDFFVIEGPACIDPFNLTTNNLTASSVDLAWSQSGTTISWDVEFGTTGFSQGSGAITNTSTNPLSVTALTANTSYDFYVRAVCGVGGNSSWIGPVSFTTLCNIAVAPISEDFSSGSLPSCWIQSAIVGPGWEFPGSPAYGVGNATDHTTGTGTAFTSIDFSGTDAGAILQMADINISALNEPTLEFYAFSNNINSTTLNDLFVEYWDGTSWQTLANVSENNADWTAYRYDLSSSIYTTNVVRIRFRAESSGLSDDYYNDILLDDISVKDDPCSAIKNQTPDGSNAYLCLGETGTINITSLNGGSINWYDAATGGNLVQTADFLSSTPTVTENYWVEEADNNGCKSLRQAVSFEVSPYQNAPSTSDNASCAGAVTTLTANGSIGSILNWYDAASGGNLVYTGTSYDYTLNNNKTFWVEQFGGEALGTDVQTSTFDSLTHGYHFTAPCDFTISGIRVPSDASTDNQFVEIVKYNPGATPAVFPAVNNDFTSLLRVLNVEDSVLIPCDINVNKGDIIGVLGCRGTNSVNSYANKSTATYNIYGNPITLNLFGMQASLASTNASNLFTSSTNNNIGRIELYYGDCSSNRTAVTASISEPSYASAGTTSVSDDYCVVNENGTDWTYYYSSLDPENLLFAIAHDPNNLGNNNFTATVSIGVQNDAGNPNNFASGIYKAADLLNQEANFIMGRHWNVVTTGTFVDPVKIRFYYLNSELAAINTAATSWMNAYNYAPNEIGVSDAIWFKTNAVVYDPLLVIGSNVLLGTIDKTDDAQAALTSSNGTNYVEIDNINNFSGGSVAINVSRAAFLDVSLTSFEVEKHEQTKSLLAWSTEREENMLGFHVERSTDGIHFERIGIVYPQGGLNQSVSYSFVDHSPLMGSNYYRLAMEEISGHIDYTLTKVVEFVGDYDNIRVQPNPFEDLVDLKVDVLAKEEITIRVYNSIGKQVYYMRRQLNKGSNTLSLEFDKTLASGAYWLQYDNGSYTQHKKIIKQ